MSKQGFMTMILSEYSKQCSHVEGNIFLVLGYTSTGK